MKTVQMSVSLFFVSHRLCMSLPRSHMWSWLFSWWGALLFLELMMGSCIMSNLIGLS